MTGIFILALLCTVSIVISVKVLILIDSAGDRSGKQKYRFSISDLMGQIFIVQIPFLVATTDSKKPDEIRWYMAILCSIVLATVGIVGFVSVSKIGLKQTRNRFWLSVVVVPGSFLISLGAFLIFVTASASPALLLGAAILVLMSIGCYRMTRQILNSDKM
ncbi:MAG: hypothetical protein AAF939_16810 [Planctomycetota bacterium]